MDLSDQTISKFNEKLQIVNEYDKVWMIITLDSDKDSPTQGRDEVLAKHGFSRTSPKGELPLPESTYIGKVPKIDSGKALVQEIWQELVSKGLAPTRILGGVIDDWKVIANAGE